MGDAIVEALGNGEHMELHETSIDGVHTLWTRTPGPLQATLMFRVGASDESFSTVGITHLLEHLIYSRMPLIHHEHNGSVGVYSTRFTMEGSAAEVVSGLAGIGRAIADISAGAVTTAEIAREVGVLQVEDGAVLPPSLAEALDARYGPRGPGLSTVDETYLGRTTAQDVASWAARYLTRENSRLVLSGPPPEDLQLDLAPGQLLERVQPPMLAGVGGTEYPSLGDEVVISFVIPPEGSELAPLGGILGKTLADRVLEQLRRAKGLIYGVEYSEITHGMSHSVGVIQLSAAPKNAVEVARSVLGILRVLRDDGISPEEHQRIIDRAAEEATDERIHYDVAVGMGKSQLHGAASQSPALWLEAYRSFTNEQLRTYLADVEESVIVGIPAEAYGEDLDAEEPAAKLLSFSEHQPAKGLTGKEYRRGTRGLFLKVPRDARLLIGPDGIDFHAGGEHQAYRYTDVVAGLWSGDGKKVYVVGHDGRMLELIAEWFKSGAEALSELQRQLRAHDPLKVVLDADEYELAEEAS